MKTKTNEVKPSRMYTFLSHKTKKLNLRIGQYHVCFSFGFSLEKRVHTLEVNSNNGFSRKAHRGQHQDRQNEMTYEEFENALHKCFPQQRETPLTP